MNTLVSSSCHSIHELVAIVSLARRHSSRDCQPAHCTHSQSSNAPRRHSRSRRLARLEAERGQVTSEIISCTTPGSQRKMGWSGSSMSIRLSMRPAKKTSFALVPRTLEQEMLRSHDWDLIIRDWVGSKLFMNSLSCRYAEPRITEESHAASRYKASISSQENPPHLHKTYLPTVWNTLLHTLGSNTPTPLPVSFNDGP